VLEHYSFFEIGEREGRLQHAGQEGDDQEQEAREVQLGLVISMTPQRQMKLLYI
jgi:hypothetical protein